ncbi:MAG: hypothetical protein ACRYFB_02560 [Janthinobacterium lividum]
MKFRRLRHKKWFKRLVLSFCLLLVFILAVVLINIYFSPVLSTQLKKTVFKWSNGLYQVDFDRSSLNVISGRIVIENLVLKPDTAVFNRLKKAGKAPNNLYTLAVDRIVFKHIHPFKLYFKKEFEVDEIAISKPNAQVIYQDMQQQEVPKSDPKTIYQQIAGTLKSIHIGQILVDNISLRYQEDIAHHLQIRHLKEINLKATDLLIDSASEYDKKRFNFCSDITAVLNHYSAQTEDHLHQYGAQSITFSSSKSSIKMVDAVFMPVKTASLKTDQQRSQFQMESDSICINHFDYQTFIRSRKISASDVTVFGRKIDFFHNRTLPKKAVDVAKNGLYTLLKNIHRDIAIKTIYFKNVDVAYAEISAKTKLRGVITFEKLNGTVSNILTGNDTLQATRKLNASLTAYLMGYGKLDARLQFDAADPADILHYQGSLGAMNLVNLNNATKPLGLIQFTNGIVTSLNFDMQANAQKATGKVTFLYHDLNVILLKQDEKNALHRMSFMSILANAFVLIRDNPRFNDSARVIDVVYLRPENASYMGLIWRSVYAGIKESIGLSAEVEQKLRQKVVDYKQNQEQRKQKKADRQERRRLRRLKRNLKEAPH